MTWSDPEDEVMPRKLNNKRRFISDDQDELCYKLEKRQYLAKDFLGESSDDKVELRGEENESDGKNDSDNDKSSEKSDSSEEKSGWNLPSRESYENSEYQNNDENCSEAKNCTENENFSDVENCSEEESCSAEENSNEEDIVSDTDEEEEESVKIVKLDKRQTMVFNYVKNLLTDRNFKRTNPRTILVEGPAGTGKTELFKELCDYVEFELKEKTIYIASTGVAALSNDEGRTVHSIFGLPLDITDPNIKCDINDFSQQVSGASIIIFDEANMADERHIIMMDKSLKELMNTNQVFGGKIIIFGCDFLQLAPVFSTYFSFKLSSFFRELNTSMKKFSLKTNHRMKRDTEHFDFIKKLGAAELPSCDRSILPVLTGVQKIVQLTNIKYSFDIDEIVEFIYPDEIVQESDLCANRVILVPTLMGAEEINDIIVKKIEDRNIINVPASDIVYNDVAFNEYLKCVDQLHEDKVLPDKNLKLWKGCLCMVIRTMYQPSTLLNGSKVIVEHVNEEYIMVRKPGSEILIPIDRKKFTTWVGPRGNKQKLIREQFPLRLCYATTIHKSQGQTLEKVGVDLRQPVFCHGQLYLALSRVRTSEDIKVCVTEKQVVDDVAIAENIVFGPLVAATPVENIE